MAVTAEEIPSATRPARKSGGKLKWLLLTLILGAGGGGAWYWFTGQAATPAVDPKAAEAAKAAPKAVAKPTFVSMGSSFIVNLAGDDALRFLQVDVQLVTRDDAMKDWVEQLQPELRNRLLLLFSAQHADFLSSRDGKVKLQQLALAEIRAGLKQYNAPTDVDAVLFTSFVMQ